MTAPTPGTSFPRLISPFSPDLGSKRNPTLLRLPSSFFGLYTSETRLILDAYAGLLDRLGPQTNLVCGLSLFYGIKEEKDVTAGQ